MTTEAIEQAPETITLSLSPANAAALALESNAIVEEANAFGIVTLVDLTTAAERGRLAHELGKKIEAEFQPVIDSAHKAHKAALEMKNKQLAPVETAKKIYAGKIQVFKEQQERVNRLWTYIGAYAIQFEADQQFKAEQERKLQQAIELEKKGHGAIADKIVDQASKASAPAPVVPMRTAASAAPKAKGTVDRTAWRAEVTDLRTFLTWVLADEKRFYLAVPNMTELNSMARSQKKLFEVPGCAAVSEQSVSFR